MRKQNRTFHVLRKPDICTCYEQRALYSSVGSAKKSRPNATNFKRSSSMGGVPPYRQLRLNSHCRDPSGPTLATWPRHSSPRPRLSESPSSLEIPGAAALI